MALFGSVARGEEWPDGDIDILVEFEPGKEGSIYDYVRLKEYVGGLFVGPVDVIDREALKPRARCTRHCVRLLRRSVGRFAKFFGISSWPSNSRAATPFETLQGDAKTLYAVVRSLEIILEASRRVSDDVKTRRPHIAWREMAAAGNVYRHNDEDVTARRVRRTLQEYLAPLRIAVEPELASIGRQRPA